ncbi:MAG: ComEC/Rec2 family competence protein [Mycobacteriales bacterium]
MRPAAGAQRDAPGGGALATMPPGSGGPLDLRLVPSALGVWLVAWQGRLVPDTWLLTLGAALAAVAGALLLSRRGGRVLVAAAVCGCTAASAVVTGLHTGARTGGPLHALGEREAAVRMEAVLIADPRRALTSGAGGRDLVVTRLRVELVTAAGRTHRLRTPVVVLSSDPAWLPLLPSQRVRVEGRLRPAERGEDVAAVLSGRGPPVVLSAPSRVHRVAGHLRAGLRRAVDPLPARERGLLPGLVVGDVSRLDAQVREDFRTVGLTHLTAVSGSNVAIVTGAVLLLARGLGVGLVLRGVLALLGLAGFVVLARPDPSVLRASVMGVIGLLALVTGTRRTAMPALAAAVILLVLVSPPLAAAPGFALSVLATAGLLVLAPRWREQLRRWMPGWLADAIAVPAAAQVACGPVVVAFSAQLGLLSVPANLLAIPAVAPATVTGVTAALLAPVWLPAAQAVAWVGWLPTAWLTLVARLGASVPGAAVPWPDGGRGALLLAALTAVVLPALARRRLRRALTAAFLGAAVATAGLAAVRPAWPPPGWFLVACDVGQGDAVVLNASGGSAVVVDAGPDPALVDGCLDRLGVRRVPLVLITHLHADHVDGLPGIVRGRRVGVVQLGPLEEPEEQAAEVVAWAARADVPLQVPALGEQRRLADLRWTVLAPGRAFRGTNSDPNNSSLVLRVEVGPSSVLLTGDVEPEAQRDLLRRNLDLRATVLKVPHHGSRHQEQAFLDAVGAAVVLTSVGADNTYGHPSADVLDRLVERGARSFRTDLDGDIALAHRDGRLVVVPRGG